MIHKGITTSLLAIAAAFIANSSLAVSQNNSLIEQSLKPMVIVSEYIDTPGQSNVTPVTYKGTDEKSSWIRNEIKNSHGRVRSLSCNSKNYCVGVGEAYTGSTTTLMAYNSYDGGNTWIPHSLGLFGGSSGLESVSCDTNQHCVAVGAATPVQNGGMQPIVYTSFNGGNSWAPNYPEPIDIWPKSSALRAISCSGNGSLNCIAVGNFYPNGTTTSFITYISNDGGIHWSHEMIGTHEGAGSLLSSISCRDNSQYCVAVGHLSWNNTTQPIIYETQNAGKNWSRMTLPFETSTTASLNGIACSPSRCVAVGSENARPVIIVKKTKDSWEKIYPEFHSVGDNRIKGLDVAPIGFSPNNGQLRSVVCDDTGASCTAVGYTRYIVTLNQTPRKRIYVTLPTIYFSSDSGSTWKHVWPGLVDESGLMHAIENVAINVGAVKI